MSRSHHHRVMRRLATALAGTVLLLLLASASPALATNVGFAFLIENGLTFSPPLLDAQGLAAFVSSGPMRPIGVNGQADFTQSLGTANVVVWSRTVPDPFFDPIGPIAALVTLNFQQPLKAHLGLIQTPGGLRTTIGVLQRVGFFYEPLPSARGEWVLSNGVPAGGGAGDLIIGGVLVVGTATPLAPLSLELTQFFPTVPFASHLDPSEVLCLNPGDCLASFYGQAVLGQPATPARTYTIDTTRLSGDGRASHLLTFHAGGDAYGVVACSGAVFLEFPPDCTLSGTGGFLGALTGGAAPYMLGPSVGTFEMPLTPFLDLP